MSNVGGVSGAQQQEHIHYFQSNSHPRYGYVAWFIILTFLFWILLMLKGPKTLLSPKVVLWVMLF